MKIALAILVLVVPTVVLANPIQSPEQSVLAALDCKSDINFNLLEQSVKSLSSKMTNSDDGKTYQLSKPLSYGKLSVTSIKIQNSPIEKNLSADLKALNIEDYAVYKKSLPKSSALIKSRYYPEVAGYSVNTKIGKKKDASAELSFLGNKPHIVCFISAK